ncbi:constitutive coactivator of PPAR-gamma-like protein 1 isoform X2 [Condylostylus longicornis]|uniref:constitutive coactivator of PPAR-gamma-like protein 1 isoform X2 n=1 Tax=Condylostylus longicornis TaxID=2530218 RepID=UPI00244E2AAE|nr:constitutive coactivator of PPAR-gamma-like protein 1 isoform X2 [Condylostylus longicornis]
MDKMIDPADLQTFINKIEGGALAVDLLKIGQKHHLENTPAGKNPKHSANFKVALDIEDCLDRFYGGYYSDWACGGQWNRAYQFVQLLGTAFKNAHIEVIAFFDGTLKKNKKLTMERNDFRQKTASVLKHIRMIGTPPPKIWWLPPSGIRTTLRNALRSVNIQVAQTVNDHHMEIIEYFHEHKLDAILGLHSDFIIANTSRYFGSHDLRLSYKGALETKEYVVSKLLTSLKLTADHLPFVAVLLGGYVLIDETKLKAIYERLKIDSSLDFEARIRKIAEIVRNSPTTDIDEFIKHLELPEFETEIKESVEYYQRRGKFSAKKQSQQKNKRTGAGNDAAKNVSNNESTPFASETNDNDEIAKKMLSEVSSLVDDEGTIPPETTSESTEKAKTNEKEQAKPVQIIQSLNYTLPGEVLKTSLNRHQRGIMDPRIYQLLTKKEIILPQILEDEQYREIPSVHLFYRPARQMIYAILFNLYHQKYLCSKRNSNNDKKEKRDKKDSPTIVHKPPEIQIAEWIWTPQNEYKKAEMVNATQLPWAVPTIQRLWFGMAFEDKQRRIKAFLTIMRSDSPLMLNRGYVPQHMLVMACVLRYIITSPDRNILTRQELDAFLAAAFSPQLPMVEYTQELVLPGVHLRGVYLATLFMQGVETASLANDACGVPLPWTMTNPWLFFDGKLFHLKLKMSTYVSTLRELCDDHIEIVLKIERFRKAILEDVEHFLLPAAHLDPMYRPGFLPQPTLPLPAFGKGAGSASAAANALHPLTAAANANGAGNANGVWGFYNPQTYFSLSQALLGRESLAGVNANALNSGRNNRSGQRNANNRKGYQLKVGVTGSWAASGQAGRAAAASLLPPGDRFAGLDLTPGQLARLAAARGRNMSRAFGNKMNQTGKRNRKRKDNKKKQSNSVDKKTDKKENKTENESEAPESPTTSNEATTPNSSNDDKKSDNSTTDNKNEIKTEIDKVSEGVKDLSLGNNCAVEIRNGTIVLASDLANSMCDEILKDDDNDSNEIKTKSAITPTKILTKTESIKTSISESTGGSGDATSNSANDNDDTINNGNSNRRLTRSQTSSKKSSKTKKNGTGTNSTNDDVGGGDVPVKV